MVEVLRMLDVPAFEQVIAVPKISWDRVPQRSALRRPQKAEQLVEVPTEPGYSLAVIAVRAMGRRAALALAEQIVNNPAPQGRRRGGGGLQGLRAGQGSTAADVEQIIDIPVPQGRRRSNGSPQGSLPGRGSTADVEQIVEIPARGGLQGFLPGQGSSSRRFLQDEDEGFQGFFRTFPQPQKSAKVTRQSSPRVPASASSSELSAHQMAPAGESGELADEPGGADLQRWRRGLRRRDGGRDFFQDGDEEEEEEVLEMFDESIDRFELFGWRSRRLCCDYMAGCCARGWGCTFAHGEQELHPTSLPGALRGRASAADHG